MILSLHRRVSSACLAAGIAACSVLNVQGGAAAATKDAGFGFIPHKAVYDIKLVDQNERSSNIRGISGRLVYEIGGDACTGFTTNFRFVLNFQTNRDDVLSDQRTSTYEAPDGSSFRFVSKSFTNENLDRETRGTAKTQNGALTIELSKPEAETVELDEAIFPTQHLKNIVEAAQNGETFVRSMVYDGADSGTQTHFTQTVIGKPKSLIKAGSAELSALPKDIASQNFWPISVSYFKQTGTGAGEELPFYQVSFKLYENGVSRDLKMSYEEFSLQGELLELQPADVELPQAC